MVYIIIEHYMYDGAEIKGVFSTKEKAQEFAETYIKNRYGSNTPDLIEIEVWGADIGRWETIKVI